MSKTVKILIALFGLMSLFEWTIKQSEDLAKAEWLIGTWENRTIRGTVYERWTKESDNEFLGFSYIVSEKDTTVFETIRLVQDEEGIFYIPRVHNQNQGLPVQFAMRKFSETQIVFENPQHDFPQIISYTQIHSDSLVAEISGVVNGQARSQRFSMNRVE